MLLEDTGRKILSIKEKGNKYIIEFPLAKVKLHKSTFDKFELKVGDVLSDSLTYEIASFEKKEEILSYARKLSSKKPYSEKELIRLINRKFACPKELRVALQELKKTNILDDEDFLKNYLNYFNKNFYGKYFIINFCKSHGVKEVSIKSLVFDDDNELEKAKSYLETIQNKYIHFGFAKQKRKLYDLMLERGFSVDVILKVLDGLKIDVEKEQRQLIKEYKKIKNKVTAKESKGVDKDSKIVNRLIDKGYALTLISKVMNLDKEGKLND